jgi:hypothetical protein
MNIGAQEGAFTAAMTCHLNELQRNARALRAIHDLMLADGSVSRGCFASLKPADLMCLINLVREDMDRHLGAVLAEARPRAVAA